MFSLYVHPHKTHTPQHIPLSNIQLPRETAADTRADAIECLHLNGPSTFSHCSYDLKYIIRVSPVRSPVLPRRSAGLLAVSSSPSHSSIQVKYVSDFSPPRVSLHHNSARIHLRRLCRKLRVIELH